MEESTLRAEKSRSLHLRENELGKREHHFDCWSWWARRLSIFFGASTGGSGRECFTRADLGKRRRDWRWRRRLVAAAAMEMEVCCLALRF